MYYSFVSHVHHVLVDEEFILLDEKSDRYYLFDKSESAALISGLMLGANNDIVQECLGLRIIEPSHQRNQIKASPSQKHGIGNHEWRNVYQYRRNLFKARHLVIAATLLASIKIALSLFGLSWTLNLLRRTKKTIGPSKKLAFDSMMSMASAIYRAGLLVPFRAQCLESAIALFLFLKLSRSDVKLFIGVQRYDFLAHAWIEVEGQVIGDISTLSAKLSILLEI